MSRRTRQAGWEKHGMNQPFLKTKFKDSDSKIDPLLTRQPSSDKIFKYSSGSWPPLSTNQPMADSFWKTKKRKHMSEKRKHRSTIMNFNLIVTHPLHMKKVQQFRHGPLTKLTLLTFRIITVEDQRQNRGKRMTPCLAHLLHLQLHRNRKPITPLQLQSPQDNRYVDWITKILIWHRPPISSWLLSKDKSSRYPQQL